jgi:uncharacterized glyoxalase superfamily protein PhnB
MRGERIRPRWLGAPSVAALPALQSPRCDARITTLRESAKQSPNSVQLTVQSVQRAVRFYKEKLGFKLTEAFPDSNRPVWANMVLGGQAVMLGQLPSLDEAKKWGMDRAEIELLKRDAKAFARGEHGAGVAIYLQVEDVDVYWKRIKRKRVKPLTRLRTQFYGLRDFQVEDEDGYRLVFYTRAEAMAPAVDAGAGDAAIG